eukprot:UN01925
MGRLARDLILLSIGFVGGYYLHESVQSRRGGFSSMGKSLGKSLDRAIDNLEREAFGSSKQPQNFNIEKMARDVYSYVSVPFVALWNEAGYWFKSAMPQDGLGK